MTDFAPAFGPAFTSPPPTPPPRVQQPLMVTKTLPCQSWKPLEACPPHERPENLRPDADGNDPVLWTQLVRTASQILWALSGRRFGHCTIEERPIPMPCGCRCACPPMACTDTFHDYTTMRLQRGPVISIDRVVINGVDQRLDQFTVADRRTLIALSPMITGWPTMAEVDAPVHITGHGPPASQGKSKLQRRNDGTQARRGDVYLDLDTNQAYEMDFIGTRVFDSDVDSINGAPGNQENLGQRDGDWFYDPDNASVWEWDTDELAGDAAPRWRMVDPAPTTDVFPDFQDLRLPLTEQGTWGVKYSYGKDVPDMGRMAVAELATELGKACSGDNSCALPRRTQNVTKQGINFSMINPQEYLDNGRLGLDLCDMFLTTYNPHRLQRAARIFRADDICNKPSPRIAPDERVPAPRENLYGHGDPHDPWSAIPFRTDGLPIQGGDFYIDVDDPARPVYQLDGDRMFVLTDQIDEAVYDEDLLHTPVTPYQPGEPVVVGDGQVGPPSTVPGVPAIKARRDGDGYFDIDDKLGTIYGWVES